MHTPRWQYNPATGKLEQTGSLEHPEQPSRVGLLNRPGFRTSPDRFKPPTRRTSTAATQAQEKFEAGQAKRDAALSKLARGGDGGRPTDPNQGAGTSDLGFLEGLMKFGPNALAVAGGPVGMGLLAARKGLEGFLDSRARGRETAFAESLRDKTNTRQTQSQVNAQAARQRQAARREAGGDSRDGRSARDHDRDRDQSRGDARSQSGPR